MGTSSAEQRAEPENRRTWYEAYAGRPWLVVLAGIVVGIALLFVGVVLGGGSREHIVPVGTFVVGTLAAVGALGQLQVARRRHEEQTKADLRRHDAQTKADFQRRVTESFTKAVEQLGNDKQLTTRLGGIYTLERISKESPDDHWTVMETLTGFVREHAQWKEGKAAPHPDHKPPTDVAVVLTVIGRRGDRNREREARERLRLDLSCTDLRGAFLAGAHLEGADLHGAHLEGADLSGAHLEGTNLYEAHLEGAFLPWAHLEGTKLDEAHLEGADLQITEGLTQAQLDVALGDTATVLPEGLTRPAHWPPAQEKG